MDQVRLETVKKIDLQPGDVLHITIGGDLGDEHGTWVPTPDDIAFAAAEWCAVLPEGTPVVFTHHMVETTIIRHALRSSTWPPKVVIHD